MNELSKTSQKIIALLLLTLGILLTNSFLSPDLPGIAKDSAPVETAKVGEAAPDFSLKDVNGKEWKLSKLKGKLVVLEWFNFGCPFVKKHYDSNNMQKLQETYTKKGVVWLSICSSGEGRQGYQKPEEHVSTFKEKNAAPSAILVDADGKVGKRYGAKATPHMFIVGKQGKLIYAGAIDDTPGFDKAEIKTARNYVSTALDEAMANKPVSKSSTKPYGCSVKYSDN